MSATKSHAPPRMSRERFRAWVDEQPGDGRFELFEGEVVPLGAERLSHALVKSRIWAALDRAIRDARIADCLAIPDGATIEIGERTDYIPDVSVHIGPRPDLDGVVTPNPVIIVEVVSPSSRRLDTTIKFADYFRVPSIQHYLVVLIGRRQVTHHRREGERIVSDILPATAPLRLDPPGLSLAVADFFADLGG